MVTRIVSGLVLAGVLSGPLFATAASADPLHGEEARRFVAGKLFSFDCFDGSRGAGRIFADGSVIGSIQFSGKGEMRYAHLPTNTLQVHADGSVCASLKGLPFEPCFNVDRSDAKNFRGSVSGMSFAYCDFHHEGQARVAMGRAVGLPRSLRAPDNLPQQQADASAVQPVAHIEKAPIEPTKVEPALELRKSAE
jgi:hypothetical protein